MKKLYYLDESEKERILTLHKKHKENLLTEQAPYKIQQGGGGWTDSAKTQFNSELNNFSTGRGVFTTGIINFCKKYDEYFPNGPSLDLSTIQSLTEKIGSAAKTGSISTFGLTGGRGMSEAAVKTFRETLLKFQNIANVCYSVANISTRGNLLYGYENIFDTFDEIYANEGNYGYKNAILANLKYLAGETKVIGAEQSTQNPAQSKEGATNLEACLKANKLPKTENGGYYFDFKGRRTFYYKDGDYYSVDENTYLNRDPKTEKTYYKFTCDTNNKIIPTKDNSTTTQQPNTGSGTSGQKIAGGYVLPNAFTPEKVSAIKTAVGSTDKSGSLTQDDINKLYAKLSQLKNNSNTNTNTNTFANVNRGNTVALSESVFKKKINEQSDTDEDTSKHSVGFDKGDGSKKFWKEEFINKPKEEQERIKNEIRTKVNEATELAKQNFIKYYSSAEVQNKLKSKFRLTDQNIKDLLTFINTQKTIIFFSEEELKAKNPKASLTAFGFAARSTPNVTYINVYNFSGDATKETYYTTIYHEIGHTISYFFQGSTGKIKIDPHSGYAITQTDEMKKDTSAQYTSNPEEDYTRMQRLRDIIKISPIINDANVFGEKLKTSLKCGKKECTISISNGYLYIYNKTLNVKTTIAELQNNKNEIKKIAEYILSYFFGLTINNTFNSDINLMFANMANIVPSQEDPNKIIGFAIYLPDLINMNNNFAAIENKSKNNNYNINSMGE